MIEQALEIDILKNLSLDMHQGINTVTENVEYLESGIPILQSKHITKGFLNLEDTKYLSEKDYLKYKDKYQANIDDVLVCNIGTIGKSLRIDKAEKFLIAWNLFLIKLDNTKLYSQYFAHYLNHLSDQNYFDKFLTGGTVKFINKKTMGNIQVPLPPLPQQQKIANILDAADALRQNDKALIAKYDELTQALFLDMFGDPVSNPKGWDVVKLKDISTKIHSGNTPKGGSEVYVETGITFFRSQNVWKKRLVYEDIAFIDQETHSKMMKSSLKHKDILMTKTGRINTENSSLGRAAIYLGEDDKANVNGHVYLIRLKKGALNEFVLHILTTKEYRGHIRSVCVGGIDKRQLNKEHIENFPIINPDIDLQIRFSKQLEVIEEQKAIAQKSLEKSESLFNSLLQKAFKGELV